jgi:tRNA threonylcarbamoyladenosine biosynthesis protein TsaB
VNILAFDTSTDILNIAIKTEKQYFSTTHSIGRKFSEELVLRLKSALKEVDLEFRDLSLIVVAKGPGSFTGLRVGMAVAKGLSSASNTPLVSLSTTELYANPLKLAQSVILPLIDAKKKRFYTALFKDGKRLSADKDLTIEQIGTLIADLDTVILTGSDANEAHPSLCDEVTSRNLSIKILLDNLSYRDYGLSMITLGRKLFEEQGADEITSGPTYVRKSDAELSLEYNKQ